MREISKLVDWKNKGMIYSCLTGSEASSEKASGATDKEKADHKGGCYERGKGNSGRKGGFSSDTTKRIIDW